MRKIYAVSIIVLLWCSISINVNAWWMPAHLIPVDSGGNLPEDTGAELDVGVCREINGERIELKMSIDYDKKWFTKLDDETKDLLLNNAEEDDYIVMFGIKSNDQQKPYPEIEPLEIQIESDSPIGYWRSTLLGKDYRAYCLENGTFEEIEIKEYDNRDVVFDVDKLGTYVLYYNPGVYSVIFYDDALEYDDEFEIVNEEYYRIDDLRKDDTFEFPEIPRREGNVFTGWKHEHSQGAYYMYEYVKPKEYYVDDSWGNWQVRAFDVREVYASWCPEEEYSPLEVTIESEKKITKGKEDGAEIILTLSEGKFYEYFEGDSFDREYYEEADEEEKERYLENWKNSWNVVGSDEVMVETVELIDETTLKLTLSGNSSDKYTESEIQIEFNSEVYISDELSEEDGAYHEVADIQLDENGIKKAMFISDNSITLEKQKKSSGGSGITKYTVWFESNGGEDVESQRIKRSSTVEEPKNPLREDYEFAGWYKDSELTQAYDFETPVTGEMTLYAAWTKKGADEIILKLGEPQAVVFGKKVVNDVAPMIKNETIMLPVRFVAEALGGEVKWDEKAPDEVKITKDGTEAIIYIGKNYATVNGETILFASEVFLENNRTYAPMEFFTEVLKCKTQLKDGEKIVVKTK